MKIFVSNLGCHVEGADLYHFFAPFGNVASATVITDRETGKSLRYGFVEMPDENSSQQAIQKLHGKIVEGRSITVSLSKEKTVHSKTLLVKKRTAATYR